MYLVDICLFWMGVTQLFRKKVGKEEKEKKIPPLLCWSLAGAVRQTEVFEMLKPMNQLSHPEHVRRRSVLGWRGIRVE